jgi:nucleoid-associated protein YgaU
MEWVMAPDKKVPDFSDVRSGSSSSARPAPGSRRSYTVVAGDSLSKIAKRTYGDTRKWRVIYEANRDTVKNPDLILPGQVLILPES